MKRKDIIDTKEQEIKLLRDNFKPSVVSGRQWEIDVEKQLISYLTKRLDYLRSLKPKTHDNAEDNWNKIGKTLDTTENTLHAIVSDYDQSKNVIKYDDEIQKLLNLKKYW